MHHGWFLRLGALVWIAGMGGTALAQSAEADGPWFDACVQEVQPIPLAQLGVNAAGASTDVGDLTIIEFDGDYTRGLTAPRQEIATRFYATHPDEYDFLIVFSTFEFETGNATAFHNLIRNDTSGIGVPPYDHSSAFGSAGRLQGYIDMAATGRYSFAPSSPRYQDLLTTFLHEMMHRWGMGLRFIDAAGNDSGDLIGSDGAHWSYFLDTDASVMLGNDWQLQQDGSFRSIDVRHRYSLVDLYAAGLAAPSEIPPLMLIRNGTGGVATDLPRLGATSGGTAEMISVDQIAAASGPRLPAADTAQKDFTAALILLKRPGESVPPDRIVELDRFRIRAEQQFIAATDGRATLRIFTRMAGGGVRLPTILQGSGPAAVTPGMAAAVDWLEARQASDGHWEDRPATALRDTVAVANALAELDPGFPGLANARAWIAAQAIGNLDSQSWRLRGTALAGDAAVLESAQNADGGFAIEPGWSSSTYDTALVGAALADASPGSPALAAVLMRAGTAQNTDGSYGIAEGGRGRALPTLRMASVLARESDEANTIRLERASDWIASRQIQDGSIGSDTGGSSLSETIEAYALAGRLRFDTIVASGLREHVRQTQQIDGDWGGSIYLTATALLARARDQRPNLAVAGVPMASPNPVHDGQHAVLSVTVTNIGNVPAAASVLRWYDGDPDDGGVQIGADLSVPELVAGSRTTASLEWDTTSQVGSHQLWVVLDAALVLEESSEQDNRSAVEVTVLPPAEIVDLALLRSDFTATPSSIATLPGNVHVSGLVRNVGAQDATGVVVRLLEPSHPETTPVEVVIDVPARGMTAVELDLVATAPRTLDLLVRADPGEAIEEASELNNEVALVIPFGQSLDLEVLPSDLVLLSNPALVGRSVEFDLVLRNRGTIDSPPIGVRAEVAQGISTTAVLDVVTQVPAGQAVTRRVAWLPSQPGAARLSVSIDAAGQVAETDETNNTAQLDFEVVALEEPDLTFVGDSLVFTPTPALEAQPLTAQLAVRNLSSAVAEEVLVALYAGDPASGAAMLGSTTIGPIEASSEMVATISVPELALRGDQRMFVKIDADDRLAEIDESNNLVIQPLRVMPLADIAISVADIELVPPLPVPGQAVEARVTVRNIGSQDAQDVRVRLLEGDVEAGVVVGADATASLLPAGASAVLTWQWTLGLAPDARSVTALADPADLVREVSDANNIASLPFDVQDGDFFASERYISPNGDGIQDAVAVVFRAAGIDPVTVEITNGAGRTVRRHENVELNEGSRGQVIWDGRDDFGRVVTDGEYQVFVVDGGVEGQVVVTVDNDRSSLLEAVDTPHGLMRELRGERRQARIPPRESPLREHLFAFWRAEGPAEGLYRSDAYFTEVVPVLSYRWLQRFQLEQGDQGIRFDRFEFSPDGTRIAVILTGSGPSSAWLVETAVDQVDSAVVLREGNLNRRVLGYFDDHTLVVGASSGAFIVVDTRNGSTTELRGFEATTQYDSSKVVPGGVVALRAEALRAFASRDPADPPLDFVPQDADGTGGYSAVLSPHGRAVAVHEYDLQGESISLFDLETGVHRVLLQAASRLVHGAQSLRTLVIPRFGFGWLERRDQLLVQDAEARSLLAYSVVGQRLSTTAFPNLQRIGGYAVDEAEPPAVSGQGDVLRSTFPALVAEGCDASSSALGIERHIFDPADNRFFLSLGETVAWEYFPEGWALVHGPGIRDYFGADVDTGHVETRQAGTLIPLIESADVATHPLRAACDGMPAADWPRIILRDGARIREDGRVQTLSHGVSADPWPSGGGIIEVWPDDSNALLSGSRAYASLLNLGALLRARTLGRGIELSGVAADRNFAYYRLDWAPIEQPNDWQALMPASEDEVFLDEFLTWVPPQPGTFLVRLTVGDKAGNTVSTFATASSFDSASIDSFAIAPRYVSPNGDGVQDRVRVGFRVRQPVTFTIRVADAQGNVLRSIDRTYSQAQLGPDEFEWDGRTGGGSVVPDGRYRISLDGFGAWVVVDNRLPIVGGEVFPAYRDQYCEGRSTEHSANLVCIEPTVTFRGSDENLAERWLESTPLGEGAWRRHHVVEDRPLPPGRYASREFRALAADRAGNRSATTLNDVQDVFILQGAGRVGQIGGYPFRPDGLGIFGYQTYPFDQPPDTTYWTSIVVDQSASTDVLVGWNYSRPVVQIAVETARIDAPTEWVENGIHEGDAAWCGEVQCSAGALQIPLDASGFAIGSRHLVRLRGERADGSRTYSNQGLILVGGIDTPRCENEGNAFVVSLDEYLDGPLASASLHYTDGSGHIRQVPPRDLADHHVTFELPIPRTAEAWVEAIDSRGIARSSPHVGLECEGGTPVTNRYVTGIGPFPVVRDQCDGLPSERVGLSFSISAAGSGGVAEPAPRHVTISYVHGITGQQVVLADLDLPASVETGRTDFEIPTEQWPEAEYEARLAIQYVDGSSAVKTTRIPVVKQPPAIELEQPREGDRVCAVPDGNEWRIAFAASIASAGHSSYRIGVGAGAEPSSFTCGVAMGEDDGPSPCVPYEGLRGMQGNSVVGQQGSLRMDLAPYNGVSTLQMKGLNWSGGTVCTQHTIHLDAALDLTERSSPRTSIPYSLAGTNAIGISPTGDPRYASGTFFLRAGEPLDLDVTLHRAYLTPVHHDLVLEDDVLETLLSGDGISGDFDVVWDGSLGGAIAPDGLYGVSISAEDGCAFTTSRRHAVLVDSTAPDADITAPATGQVITSPIVEIAGRVTDNVLLRSWSLDFALAESPDAWQNLARGERDVPLPSHLATWSRGSITGVVDLRLSATDYLGNRSETHLPLMLGEPARLIGAAALQPALFSPNGDSVLDATRLQLGLLQPATIDVRVTDAGNGTIATLYSGPQPAGTLALPWNGTANAGQVVADGTYQVRVDASDPLGIAQPEAIALVAIVDATPPTVEIRQPSGEYAASTSLIEIGLGDTHFAGYTASLARATDGVVVFATEGTQAGELVLTSLADFPEGRYDLRVEARDAAGNMTAREVVFHIDSTRPDVRLVAPLDGALIASASATSVVGAVEDANLSQWTLEVAGETDGAWVEVANGYSNRSEGELLAWTPSLPDGRYRLRLRAVDRADNEAEVVHLVDVDGTPPVASITAPVDGSFLKADAVVEGIATDAHFDSYRLSLIKAALVESGQWSDVYLGIGPVEGGQLAALSLDLDEDDYLLRLVVTDRVGLSSSQQVSVRIDARAPQAPLALVGRVEGNRDAVLDWQAVDASDLAGYVVYRDGERLNDLPVAMPHHVDADVPEGLPKYRVTAIDHAGNESEPSNTVTLLVDRTPPTAAILQPGMDERVRGIYGVTGTAHSADDFKEYRLTMQPVDPPGAAVTLANGTLAVQGHALAAWDTLQLADETRARLLLEAEDVRGNVAVSEVVVTIDNGPPAAPTGLAAAIAGADAQVHWDPNGEADLLGYLLYRDNQLVNAAGPTLPGDLRPFALTAVDFVDVAVPDGQHQYVVYAIDRAGNVSSPSDPALLDPLDNAPPSMTIESPLPGLRFESDVTVLATSRDTDIAEVRFAYRVQGGSDWTDIGPVLVEAPYRVTWVPTADVEFGDYEIRALARDAGGRSDPAPPSVAIVYADLTSPPAPAGLTARADGDVVRLAWSASDASDLAGYRVHRDGASLDDVPATTLVFDDASLDVGSYAYVIKAFDGYGNESVPSNTAVAHVFGVELDQPYTPTSADATGLAGISARPGNIALHVESEAGASDTPMGPTAADGSFGLADRSLQVGSNVFTLRVTDALGNISRSASVRVDRGAVPAAPTGVELTIEDHDVLLRWDENPEPDVIGYRVFRNGGVLDADTLLGEVPMASSAEGMDPQATVDGNPSTAWSTYVIDGDAGFDPDWHAPALELAWTEPRIVSAIRLSWLAVEAVASEVEVFTWSGHAWVRVWQGNEITGIEQTLTLARPYRTTRMKIVLRGHAGSGEGSYRELQLAEVRVEERPLRGARNLAESLPDGSHAYQVTAVNAFAFESPPSEVVVAGVGDTQGPDPVTLSGELLGRDGRLAWTASDSPDVARYDLLRDGTALASISAAEAREYVDVGLGMGAHAYSVVALDGAGNPGLPSNTVVLTVVGEGPATPIDLTVTAPPEGAALDLSWQPSPGSTPDHYIVRRSLSLDGTFDLIAEPASTAYRDAPLANGTTYFYTVEAVDAFGDASGPGAPASGTPRDRIAPAPPLLTYPTVASDLLHQDAMSVDICGKSEAGAIIDLESTDGLMAAAIANAAYSTIASGLPPSGDSSLPAPDGRHIAITDYASTRIVDLLDASIEHLGPHSRLHRWAAHGLALYFAADDSDLLQRWDPVRGIEQVPHAITTIRSFGVDARETRIAIAGEHAASGVQGERIWIVDRAGGAPLEVGGIDGVAIGSEPFLSWSPDGRYLLLASEGVAWLIDAELGVAVTQWSIDAGIPPTWSSEGGLVAYVQSNLAGGHDLQVFDVATQTGALLLAGTSRVYALAWSPAGDEIAMLDEAGVGILAWPSGATTLPRPYQGLHSWTRLAWTASGTLAAHDTTSLLRIEQPGWFCTRSTALAAGLNQWSARATDSHANHGFASAPIHVEVADDQLPDLAITEADILVVPASGSTGESFAAAVTLRNAGTAAVERPELAVDLDRPDGNRIALPGPVFPSLAPGQSRTVTYAIGVLDVAGNYRVSARADPAHTLFESNEGNNGAATTFVVGADGTPVLEAFVARAVFGPGETVAGEVAVTNPGPAFSGRLLLRIVDAEGVLVADLGDRVIPMLGFGQRWTTAVAWDAEGVLAGGYRLQADLQSAAGAPLAQADVAFTIEAVRHIQLAVGTTTPVQTIGRDVVIRSELDFSDGNALLEGGLLRLVALDAQGIEQWRREQPLGTLLPGHRLARDDTWSTIGLAEGLYVLRLSLLSPEHDATVETSVTLQHAAPGIPLSGSLAFEPGVPLVAGQSALLRWQVTNHAATDLAGVQARVRVVAVPSQAPVGEVGESFDLGPDTSHSSSLVLDAPPLALVAHAAILEARLPGDPAGAWRLLAQQGFAVVDRMSPMITVSSPTAGTTQPAIVPFRASILDRHSTVAVAEFSVDGGGWQPVSVGQDGQYARGITGLIDGPHQLRVRARDTWGNESFSDVIPFVVDATPPLITITGVADGDLLNHAVTPQVTIVEANLATSEILLDGLAFVSGTPVDQERIHVLTVRASDHAGNQALRSVRFTIDRTAPGAEILSPADGAVIGEAMVRIDVRTEAAASVVLSTGAHQANLMADDLGMAIFEAVPLVPGSNHVTVVATDGAGNAGPPDAIDLTYEIVIATPLIGVLQPDVAELPYGEPLRVHVVAQNPNATPMPAQTLRIRVSDAAMVELATHVVEHDFAPHETFEVDLEFPSADWPLGILTLVLEFDDGGAWLPLDTRVLPLVDRTPPMLSLDSPTPDSVMRSPLLVSATANDALSGVTDVAMRVDGGDWVPLSAASGDAWVAPPVDLVEGTHAIELQAHDGAGNASVVAAVPFAIDDTAPLINIAGVADGDLLAHAVTPKIDISDPHLATSDVRLNGQPFLSGTVVDASGDYLLDASATDAAGNANAVAVRFTLDLEAPMVEFLAPDPGAVVSEDAVDVIGRTEPRAHVYFVAGGFSVDLDADADGRFEVQAVPLEPGENILVAHAVDLAGNSGEESTLTVVREVAAQGAVTGEIGLLPSPLQAGAWLDVPYTVANVGDAALLALPLRFELRGPSGGDPVAFDEFTLDLPPGVESEGVRRLDTTALAQGSYTLSMHAHLPDAGGPAWILLDIARLGIDAGACRRGDMIFADGFDGAGVRRDGTIFCDGFELREDLATMLLAGMASWNDVFARFATSFPFTAIDSASRLARALTVAQPPRTPLASARPMVAALRAPPLPLPPVRREWVMPVAGRGMPRSQGAQPTGWLGGQQ